MNLFKGKIDAALILPFLIGLIYAGTGGWTSERWTVALSIMGYSVMGKSAYERGLNTYNPKIRSPEEVQFQEALKADSGHHSGKQGRDARGRFMPKENKEPHDEHGF